MATLDDIILKEGNPFDPITFTTGNFWTDNQPTSSLVESIHQEAINQVTETLVEMKKDHATRSIILEGDRGSGRSYLLGRLKKKLNSEAFFAYIEPWPSNDYMWRHTLRYVVNSLIYTPKGQQESQLLLWLKSLPVFYDQGLIKLLLGERKAFINQLTTQYPHLDQAQQFFSILYELTQPDKSFLAYQWLRGDDLSEEDLENLGVHRAIDDEVIARLILGNFGKITDATIPIVLCFDQVELGPQLSNGSRDISGFFKINTTFHNNQFKNFLVIISIERNNWNRY
ncbi:P-loop NTPase fold protein [Chroococcus sp. FPU101]|uniref:P-loop NTPase fold protein n=1 Tax=Chroococcus sp. FPU101 TaxID=1974212 RepID=UPI001A8EBFF1|nr:P-loop NTPase fold protein [Chroococcus sp. FPU101]GFE67951.1 hypothetical protein CFPU101_05610 [Chroococcus sp. FPU101]